MAATSYSDRIVVHHALGGRPVVQFRNDWIDDRLLRSLKAAGFSYGGVWSGSISDVARLLVERSGAGVELTFEVRDAIKDAWPTLPADMRDGMRSLASRPIVERTDEDRLAEIEEWAEAERQHFERKELERQRAAEVGAFMTARRGELLAGYRRFGASPGTACVAVAHLLQHHADVFESALEVRTAMRLANKVEDELYAATSRIEDAWAWYLALRHRDLVPREGRRFERFWIGVDRIEAQEAA